VQERHQLLLLQDQLLRLRRQQQLLPTAALYWAWSQQLLQDC
jgi:hypothetical protein